MKNVSAKPEVCRMCRKEKPVKRVRLFLNPDGEAVKNGAPPSGRYWLGENCLRRIKEHLERLKKGAGL